MAPFKSPTESNATAASSCLRSSLSWPAYAVATATRRGDTVVLRGAVVEPPTRRPRKPPAPPKPDTEETFCVSSFSSLFACNDISSSRSRSIATAMACGNSRRFAANAHALSASPPFNKFSTALRHRPSLTSTSALRRDKGRACKRSSSGTYSPGSIPGARWPTKNAVLKSYVPIAASNRFLPPSKAKRWSRAASESTSEFIEETRSMAFASRAFLNSVRVPETTEAFRRASASRAFSISASRRLRTRESAPSKSGGTDLACAESITSSHRSGRSASTSARIDAKSISTSSEDSCKGESEDVGGGVGDGERKAADVSET
mmetsp:Transcript_12849/g.53861  ORF Transcript_12849/g.53861 Transcript_12849/m.53861 type:complete len:319 (-) Transcript_12849:3344-4300(-)